MNQEEIKKLAVECGFLPPLKWLQDYTAAVEAPLQADIQILTSNLIKVQQAWEITHKNTEDSLYEQLRIANGDLNQTQYKFEKAKARIAQLEEALQAWLNEKDGYALNEALTKKTSDTWLSEHDKEVEARMLKNMIDADTEGWICSGSFKGMLVEMLKARGLK